MSSIITGIISVFTDLPALLASIGLMLATSSFISGLQLVRATSRIERKIHRFNGFTTLSIYIVLAVLAHIENGLRFWALIGWMSGLSLVLMKIWLVRQRKKARAYKYASWIGAILVMVWMFMVYIHIPV